MSTSPHDPLAAALAAVPRIGVEEALRLIEDEQALLVDVREQPELAQTGRLAGALHIPRALIESGAWPGPSSAEAELGKDRPIILYCAAGIRSALAGKALRDLGYQHVVNLGGFADAARSGMPTEPA